MGLFRNVVQILRVDQGNFILCQRKQVRTMQERETDAPSVPMQQQESEDTLLAVQQRTYAPGTKVYDPAGTKIGTVSTRQEPGYLVVSEGFIFTKEVYLPIATIGGADADAVYLLYTKDELLGRSWGAPATSQTASAGQLAATQQRPAKEAIQAEIHAKHQEMQSDASGPLPG